MSKLNLIDANIAKLGSSNTEEAFGAIKVLKTQGIQVLPALIEHLKVSDDSVRTMIVIVLGELGEASADAASQVASLVLEDNEQLRMASALTLTRIGRSSVPHLQQIFTSNNKKACFWAAWAMSFVDPTKVNEKLLELLKDTRENPGTPIEAFAAEEAIGKILANRLQE